MRSGDDLSAPRGRFSRDAALAPLARRTIGGRRERQRLAWVPPALIPVGAAVGLGDRLR